MKRVIVILVVLVFAACLIATLGWVLDAYDIGQFLINVIQNIFK